MADPDRRSPSRIRPVIWWAIVPAVAAGLALYLTCVLNGARTLGIVGGLALTAALASAVILGARALQHPTTHPVRFCEFRLNGHFPATPAELPALQRPEPCPQPATIRVRPRPKPGEPPVLWTLVRCERHAHLNPKIDWEHLPL
jgi:hypothetical protein